jgi:hypothetical protein
MAQIGAKEISDIMAQTPQESNPVRPHILGHERTPCDFGVTG